MYVRLWIVILASFLFWGCRKNDSISTNVNFLAVSGGQPLSLPEADFVIDSMISISFAPYSSNDSVFVESGFAVKFLPMAFKSYYVDLKRTTLFLINSDFDNGAIPGTVTRRDSTLVFQTDLDLDPSARYTVYADFVTDSILAFPKKVRTYRYRFPINFGTRGKTGYFMDRYATSVTDCNRDGTRLERVGDYLFSYGGWTPDSVYNEIYRSGEDLSKWTKLGTAPWFPRHTFGAGKIDSTLYIFGGDFKDPSFDVWKTNDGENFQQVTSGVDELSPRIVYGATAHNNKLYVIGGQTSTDDNAGASDVWTSDNGAQWKRIASGLPFAGKNLSGAVASFNGDLWVIGGGYYSRGEVTSQFWTNEIYKSKDGTSWERQADPPWPGRQYGDVCVWNNCLWLIGGVYDYNNLNDIWFMRRNGEWERFETPPLFEGRHASGLAVYQDKLIITCGNLHNDCWAISRLN